MLMYDFEIVYVPGSEMGITDYLSIGIIANFQKLVFMSAV